MTRAVAATVLAVGLATAGSAVASQGSGRGEDRPQGGSSPVRQPSGSPDVKNPRGGAAPAGKRQDCRAPGKGLAPVRGAAVGAGGQIDIAGSGQVRLDGSFMAWGTVKGMTVRVTDRAGDGMVRVGAACVPLVPGSGGRRTAVITSPGQRFLVDGTRMRVEIAGPGSLAIAVTGSGTGVLKGVGTFTVNNGERKGWPLKPIDLALAPTG